MDTRHILVIDGHDGAGKTTIARHVAERLGWRYVKPFQGEVSEAFYRHLADGDFEALDAICQADISNVLASWEGESLVFDRHWLTMLSVLPYPLHSRWRPAPPTVLCWADPATTMARVTARGEERRNTLAYHQRYCGIFLDLAQRYGVPVIDTARSSPAQAAALVGTLLHDLVGGPR